MPRAAGQFLQRGWPSQDSSPGSEPGLGVHRLPERGESSGLEGSPGSWQRELTRGRPPASLHASRFCPDSSPPNTHCSPRAATGATRKRWPGVTPGPQASWRGASWSFQVLRPPWKHTFSCRACGRGLDTGRKAYFGRQALGAGAQVTPSCLAP